MFSIPAAEQQNDDDDYEDEKTDSSFLTKLTNEHQYYNITSIHLFRSITIMDIECDSSYDCMVCCVKTKTEQIYSIKAGNEVDEDHIVGVWVDILCILCRSDGIWRKGEGE